MTKSRYDLALELIALSCLSYTVLLMTCFNEATSLLLQSGCLHVATPKDVWGVKFPMPEGFLNGIEDLDFTCLSFLYRWNMCYKVRTYRFRRIFESVLNRIVLYTLLYYTWSQAGKIKIFDFHHFALSWSDSKSST